jgi:hypothetical protein
MHGYHDINIKVFLKWLYDAAIIRRYNAMLRDLILLCLWISESIKGRRSYKSIETNVCKPILKTAG